MNLNTIVENFQYFLKSTSDKNAAAALTLAAAITELAETLNPKDRMSHEISLGIRKGLFGADAANHRNLGSDLEDALYGAIGDKLKVEIET